MIRSPLRKFALLAGLTALVSTVATAGPPWIAIEYPSNPHDPYTRDALLTVRTYHHGDLMAFHLSGTAEGIVNGKRQSMPLDIRRLPQAGIYAVRWQKPAQGSWMLVITSSHEENGPPAATALVMIDSHGGVASINVPYDTIENGRWHVPRRVAASEVDAMLRGAATLARQ